MFIDYEDENSLMMSGIFGLFTVACLIAYKFIYPNLNGWPCLIAILSLLIIVPPIIFLVPCYALGLVVTSVMIPVKIASYVILSTLVFFIGEGFGNYVQQGTGLVFGYICAFLFIIAMIFIDESRGQVYSSWLDYLGDTLDDIKLPFQRRKTEEKSHTKSNSKQDYSREDFDNAPDGRMEEYLSEFRLRQDYNLEDLATSYKRLMKKHHPDRVNKFDPNSEKMIEDAESICKEINRINDYLKKNLA
jgi:hypothetical protein